MNFSERIKFLREQRGWSQEQLARRANKPRSNIASLETRGAKRMSLDMLTALANAFDMSVSEFIGEDVSGRPQNPDQLWQKLKAYQPVSIPVRGSVPCGTPGAEEESIEEYISLPREQLRGKQRHGIYALRVSGQSLAGDGIHPGDYVVIEPGASVVDGKIYIIRLDNEVVARHIQRVNGKFKLTASNGDYRDIEPDQVEVLGRVIISGNWKDH